MKKSWIALIVLVLLVGVWFFMNSNTELFQGRLVDGIEVPEVLGVEGALPDLAPELEVVPPAEEGEDLKVKATIKNIGQGGLSGDTPFKYAIYINDKEVFSNTDSYSVISPGDAFSFTYPISKAIYNYPDTGTVKLVLDVDDNVEETDEGNNEVEVGYGV